MGTRTTQPRTAKEQFDRQAAHYNKEWNSWSAETLQWILDNSSHTQTDAVLDIATGTGFMAIAFAPHVARVIGVDVSPGMLAQAERAAAEQGLANVTFQTAPAELLPFRDAEFDIVSCRIAAHHFLDVGKFASETSRVLKPGGRLVLVDTSVPDDDPETAAWQNAVEVLRDTSHKQNYTPREWRRIVENAGLDVEIVTDTNGGITIPLNDWIYKAGCTSEQASAVRDMFANASDAAREAFAIRVGVDGETTFTWKRVALKATKS